MSSIGALSVALQMDPIETINIDGDSTFVLALEAQRRGYALFHYLPQALSFAEGRILARGNPLTVRREKGAHFDLGESEVRDLSDVDVVLMRQDPPFDMAYITATHILQHIHPHTLVDEPRDRSGARCKRIAACAAFRRRRSRGHRNDG